MYWCIVLKLFGTAGIRMKYLDKLDPVTAYKIGLATAKLGLSKKSYIVYDPRVTNHLFTYSFASGLMAGGLDTYIVGLAPTPVAAYAAWRYNAVGVSVTASHNPPDYNGFKLYDPEGYEFTRDLEGLVEKYFDEEIKPVDWSSVGHLYYRSDVIYEYIEDMINRLGEPTRSSNPYIVIDLANGTAGEVSPTIIRKLGAKPLTINANPDGFFPIRSPEPRKDVLEKYMSLYSSLNPLIILAHDGDADRLAVLDPVKGFIRQDRIIALYILLCLSERRGRVIVSVDTGRVVDEVAEKHGGIVERYVLGKTHERVKELGANNIVLAAEPWKLIDTRWGPWVDGVWQVGLLTKLVVEKNMVISKILEELGIPDYPWDRRSYLIHPANAIEKIYREIVEELKSLLGEPLNVISIDGYRYEYDDHSWLLVRMSGTEPKIRVYMEAMDRDRLSNMIELFEKRFRDIVAEHAAKIIEITIG